MLRAEISGLDNYKLMVDQLRHEVAACTSNVHRRQAHSLAAAIIATAPRDTGRLAATVNVRERNSWSTDVVVGEVGGTDYLGFNEFGRRGQEARPFVRPAAANAESIWGYAMKDEARKRIRWQRTRVQ